jgi:hypothetical protein
LAEARSIFEEAKDEEGVVRVLHAEGLLAVAAQNTSEALEKYLDALDRLRLNVGNPKLELAVRLSLCELHFDSGRSPDAEDEARRGEELAIRAGHLDELARFYVILGRLRRRDADENGFVFFEKALDLSRGLEPAPRVHAEILVEYARFRAALADPAQAKECLERAREMFELLADEPGIRRVEAEARQISAR